MCQARSTEEEASKMILLSALEAHRIKTTCLEYRKDYPYWWGSETKDICGRRFNIPDEKEQDFLIATDPPSDLEHWLNWLKREGIPGSSPGQEEICHGCTNVTSSHWKQESGISVWSPALPHTGTFRHQITAYLIN